jgi:hypothetical protein
MKKNRRVCALGRTSGFLLLLTMCLCVQFALFCAAARGHAEVVSLLLEYGANIELTHSFFDMVNTHRDFLSSSFAFHLFIF